MSAGKVGFVRRMRISWCVDESLWKRGNLLTRMSECR